jgi:trimeric autotransporter adhesin
VGVERRRPAGGLGAAGRGRDRQEVERVFPDLVETDPERIKRVAYYGLIGPIIQAVKELDARLEEVEQRLDRLDAQS